MSNTEVDPEIPDSALFPLPFRVVFLTGLGVLGWATNVHVLCAFLDPTSSLELRTEGYSIKSQHPIPVHRWTGSKRRFNIPLYKNIYRICAVYFLWLFVTWSLYSLPTRGNPLLADEFKFIAAISIMVILGVLICPFDAVFRREREQFLHALKRCLFPASGRVYFSDVVFADIFTSFAKILGDFWLSFYMLLPGNNILTPPHDSGWKWLILPTIMSLPYLVRLRQCLIEYNSPSTENSRRPLFNALKYATSFPVIYLSASQRVVLLELAKEKGNGVFANPWHGELLLFRLWFLAAIINSLYSFWWDITRDWGLTLLKPQEDSREARRLLSRESASPLLSRRSSQDTSENTENGDASAREYCKSSYQCLRPTLLYPVYIYPLLVVINFVLRMTWSIKLSSHLHINSDGTYIIFYVEVAEIVRRWLWVFIRVEWETVRRAQSETSKTREGQGEMGSWHHT